VSECEKIEKRIFERLEKRREYIFETLEEIPEYKEKIIARRVNVFVEKHDFKF
jgi:hypothetical protein